MPPPPTSELRNALVSFQQHFRRAAFFSVFSSLLVLAPTAYMSEVYDRVVTSRSHLTLLMLTLLVLAAYVVLEVLEWVRADLLTRGGMSFDEQLHERVFNAVFRARLHGIPGTLQAFSDLRSLREFLASPALTAVLDAPVSLLLLILIFAIHPVLGLVSLLGAVVIALIALNTQRSTQKPMAEAGNHAASAQAYVDAALRHAEVVQAMGMKAAIKQRWLEKQRNFLRLQAEASDHGGNNSAWSKFVQTVQGSSLLGVGAWLIIRGDFTGSSSWIIMSSIIGSRAISPIVQLITQWKSIASAREAYDRLENLLNKVPERQSGMPLPPPAGHLALDGVSACAPGSNLPILRNLSFSLAPGSVLGIIGPSASGKSTLARLLVGLWPSSAGKVRLDGADIYAWNKQELGPYLGYLPQDIELFDGTLGENISRFGNADPVAIEDAARAVGIHELIAEMPKGYDSRIGEDGAALSGGQRQRVALARAIYGSPRLVVLDEPNANLDEAGEKALLQTIGKLKAQGTTTIVISHRTSILPAVDQLMILRDGAIQSIGPRDEILGRLKQAATPVAPVVALSPT